MYLVYKLLHLPPGLRKRSEASAADDRLPRGAGAQQHAAAGRDEGRLAAAADDLQAGPGEAHRRPRPPAGAAHGIHTQTPRITPPIYIGGIGFLN